jgi:tetratricopeptide (TPR) repeat protein
VRQALQIKPDYAEAYCNLGALLHECRKYEDAVTAYRQAIGIKPDYAEAYCNLGAALRKQGKLDEAVAAQRQAIRLKPDLATAHSNLGAALHDQGKLDEAVATQRQAIRMKPDLATAHSNLGAVLYDQGELEEAVLALRQAIVLNPNLDVAHGNMGSALIGLGRSREGRAALERAIHLAPRNIAYRRRLGELEQYVAGDSRLAELEELSKKPAMLLEEDRIELHFLLGKAYDEGGRHEEAFGHWFEGNALKRRRIAYDEVAMLKSMDRVRAVFTRELIGRWRNVGHRSSVPVFIVGMPRSGSTLVEQILASHPEVFGGGELKHF